MNVGDPLAQPELQRLQLAWREHGRPRRRRQRGEGGAHRGVVTRLRYRGPMPAGNLEIAAEVRLRLRPPPYREEIDQLDQQARPSAAGTVHGAHQLAKPRHEPIVADAQQRTARHVADARGLDDDGAGLAAREPFVPAEDLGRHEAVSGRAPRHHRRDPRALREPDRADLDRREQARVRGASAAPGQRAGGSGCRMRSGGFHIGSEYKRPPRGRQPDTFRLTGCVPHTNS